jgi:hypothetical protein
LTQYDAGATPMFALSQTAKITPYRSLTPNVDLLARNTAKFRREASARIIPRLRSSTGRGTQPNFVARGKGRMALSHFYPSGGFTEHRERRRREIG